MLPVIREIHRRGIQTLHGIARVLAARGIPTARGGAWTAVQVSDILPTPDEMQTDLGYSAEA